MLNIDDFIESFGTSMKVRMNISSYHGEYRCACGSDHVSCENIRKISQGKWKLMMVCPVNEHIITNVKVNVGLAGFGKFKGYESLYGTKLETEKDFFTLNYYRRLLQ